MTDVVGVSEVGNSDKYRIEIELEDQQRTTFQILVPLKTFVDRIRSARGTFFVPRDDVVNPPSDETEFEIESLTTISATESLFKEEVCRVRCKVQGTLISGTARLLEHP